LSRAKKRVERLHRITARAVLLASPDEISALDAPAQAELPGPEIE
jgi:hypothetical protein